MLRVIIAASVGSIVAVWLGVSVANEDYVLASIAFAISGWALLAWRGGPYPEAWLIAAVLFGNILGNRGFAQISLVSHIPLLPAEAALLVGLIATAIRMAQRRTTAVRRDLLNLAIIGWMLIGTARLWWDARAYGVLAVRDFATVYYALFFFVAQALRQHRPSARLLRSTLLAAVVILPLTFLVYRQIGESIQRLTVRGTPLIFYKDDLVAAYLFAGFFLLMTVPSWPAVVRSGLAIITYATAFSINSSRAAIVGLGVTSIWWAAARRWAPWKLQACAVPIGIFALALLAIADRRTFSESRLFTLYEHVASIVDVGGTRNYSSEDRRFVGNNNRFRLFWWQAVIDETREGGLWFGLGFGANLAERFIRNYELDLGEDFNVRSPHSIIFSVFGRMGLLGLLAFLTIVLAMGIKTLRLAYAAQNDDQQLTTLGWWSVSWVMLVSSCFGVVLEGPMGAVVFWTALGMANASTPASETQLASFESPDEARTAQVTATA